MRSRRGVMRLPIRLAVAAFALGLGSAAADGIQVSEEDAIAYAAAPHFKALAASAPSAPGPALVRFSFNYDTPETALRAALAYCEEARRKTDDPDQRSSCRPVRIGPYPAEDDKGNDLPADRLQGLLDRYLEESIAALRKRLELSNDRATRTSLETILHKSGRLAESEALLTDLAASGESLARNALAYHWAERNTNLGEALAYAESAIASDPETASFRDTRALVLYRLGRIDEATAESERAVALDPHPIILDHYGDLLWVRGQCADAARAWQRAVTGSQDILFRQRVEKKIATGLAGPPAFD